VAAVRLLGDPDPTRVTGPQLAPKRRKYRGIWQFKPPLMNTDSAQLFSAALDVPKRLYYIDFIEGK